ncbi:MAG: carboxypeptidase-like regulatory domain-containing protein [Candidatus Micrarchaeia archaeon]
MRFLFACVVLSLMFLAYATLSEAAVSAYGGNITKVNFSVLGASDRWFAFYGNSSGSSANSTISLGSDIPENYSDAARLRTYGGTFSYYLISSDSSPFGGGSYSYPNLTLFDSNFGLANSSTISYIFDSNSTFILYTGSDWSNVSLSLPTLYLSGQNANGSTNSNAFRQGLVQKGTSFLFIVPVNATRGFDGRTFDFEFALPYASGSTNQYYIFAVSNQSTPTPTPTDTGQSVVGPLPSLSFGWAYDGKTLYINTEPGATVWLRDELGATYSGVADAKGAYSYNAPAGFKYYIAVTKSGYGTVESSIYIPLPIIVKSQNNTPVQQPTKVDVVIETTPSGPVVCIGNDCYSGDFATESNVQALSELSCSGSICRFVGISEADFIEKYKLRRVSVIRQSTSSSPFASSVDFSSMFNNLGYELSSGLGSMSAWPQKEQGFFLYAFMFFAIAALIVYVFKSKLSRPKFNGGYD